VVLFEGWCLGFSALPNEALKDPRLVPINARLATDYLQLHEAMDAWVVVEVESPTTVYAWREQAEANMRAAGKPAMTPAQVRWDSLRLRLSPRHMHEFLLSALCVCFKVKDFVDRYMPAYAAYLEGLYQHGPAVSKGPVLSFQIDHGRNPVADADATPFFVQ
jgi:D-glycerate 3-kinase